MVRDREDVMSIRPQRFVFVAFIAAAAASGQPIPIGTPVVVNATTAGQQDLPRIAADNADNFQIVWETVEGEPPSSNVRRRRLSSEGVLGTDSLISESATGEQTQPVVDMNASGDWVAAWLSDHETAGDIELFSRRTSEDGTFLEEELQLDVEIPDADSGAPSVARSPEDSFATLYRDESAPDQAYTRSFTDGGSPWAGAGELGPIASNVGTAIAGIGEYAFVTVWQATDANFAGVNFNCTYLGNPNWLALTPYDDPTGSQTFPDVASDGAGRIVVVWQQDTDIFGRILSFEGGTEACDYHSEEIHLNSDPVAAAIYPRVGMAADGAFVVTWASNVEADGSISAREFTKSGLPVGDQFQAHPATPGSQYIPDVAVSAGTFAIVWRSPDAGVNPPDDIVVRRFTRRVVFTDDFELFGTAGWSSVEQ
jgi:hypothetical protein